MAVALERVSERLPAMVVETLREQWARVARLDEEIGDIERRLKLWHRDNAASQRIAEIPGVGVLSATGRAPAGERRRCCAGEQDGAHDLGLAGPCPGVPTKFCQSGRVSAVGDRNHQPRRWHAERLRKVRQGVMANRSDRDPPSLHVVRGEKPSRRMRRGSADSIGASRHKPCTNRPHIELQPVVRKHQIVPRKPGGVHIDDMNPIRNLSYRSLGTLAMLSLGLILWTGTASAERGSASS